jgi:hypothetical protein
MKAKASVASVLLMAIASYAEAVEMGRSISGMPPIRSLLARFAITTLALSGLATSALAGVVRGKVVLAPMCPGPIRVGQECAAKPITTTIDVFRYPNDPSIPGKPYRRIKSDKQGYFQISLDPHTYWFVPHVPQLHAGISFAKPVEVVVTTGTTTITLVVDTGMR